MLVILVVIMFSGCAVGPNYHRPNVHTPSAFRGDSQQVQAQTASFADLPWWKVLNDPQLQDLIRTALKHNYCSVLVIGIVLMHQRGFLKRHIP